MGRLVIIDARIPRRALGVVSGPQLVWNDSGEVPIDQVSGCVSVVRRPSALVADQALESCPLRDEHDAAMVDGNATSESEFELDTTVAAKAV
ncbi:hypothetical protein GCM10022207_92110 [Streptomyces lannensis]|uniref:Uncharacterized protein n=1 Tax=Streptomyces lannensis TaxID=766498 RepID=A0ABP7LYT7_9ACTN